MRSFIQRSGGGRRLGLERGLNIHCGIIRLDHAGELGQNVIAGQVDQVGRGVARSSG